MIQTTYGSAPDRAKRGQIQRREYLNGRFTAIEDLEPDVAVVYAGYPLNKEQIRKPMQTKFTTTASIPLEASNSTVGTVTLTPLGGEASATNLTATVYGSSSALTLAAIAAKIAAIEGILSAEVSGNSIIVIAEGDIDVALSGFTTTLGSNQAEWSYEADSADTFAGFTTNIDKEPDDDGYCYKAGDTVKVLQRGRVSAVVEEAVNGNSALHARFAAGSGTNEHRGVVRASAGSGPVVAMPLGSQAGCYLAAGADEIADLEVNHLGA
jgi:hypothetical protein